MCCQGSKSIAICYTAMESYSPLARENQARLYSHSEALWGGDYTNGWLFP